MSRLNARDGISNITRSQITCTVSIPTSVCLLGSLPGGQDETIAVVAPDAPRQNNAARTIPRKTIFRISTSPPEPWYYRLSCAKEMDDSLIRCLFPVLANYSSPPRL